MVGSWIMIFGGVLWWGFLVGFVAGFEVGIFGGDFVMGLCGGV